MLTKSFTQQKHKTLLGVIGGVGPETTAKLYKEIVKRFFERTEGNYPSLCIDNLPINNEIEESFIKSIVTPAIRKQMEGILTECVKRLQNSGSKTIVLPCNTLHTVIEPIVKEHKVNLIHIVEETINEVLKRGFNRIGMICSNSTRYLEAYEKYARQHNLELIYPSIEEQIEVNNIITQILNGQYKEEILVTILKNLEKKVDCIVLGCTDLWQIAAKEHIQVPIIDSLECLIESCMSFYLHDEQEMADS
ncbi:amino acid racemase [Bacillus thuringiensis]